MYHKSHTSPIKAKLYNSSILKRYCLKFSFIIFSVFSNSVHLMFMYLLKFSVSHFEFWIMSFQII